MRCILTVIVTGFMFISPSHAQTNEMAVEVASDHIDVTSGFTGSSIEFFGDKRDKEANIVIIVEGPKRDVAIWKKERVLGAWLNRYFVEFQNVPLYYQYAVSDPSSNQAIMNTISENAVLPREMIMGLKYDKSKSVNDISVFADELLKKKRNIGVYFEEPAEVKFINDSFFRIRFDIPPTAPTGEYLIHSLLVKNGTVLQHSHTSLKVEQVGMNAFVNQSSRENSLVYALVCIFFALFSGWLFSVLRVKP